MCTRYAMLQILQHRRSGLMEGGDETKQVTIQLKD